MSSPADRVAFALAAALLGCGANSDHVLGEILPGPDTIPRIDASPGMPDGAGVCTSFNSTGREVASDLDVYFVIDRSQAMLDQFNDKWDRFVSGFNRFLSSRAADNVGIGAGYFPARGNIENCSHCPPHDCGCFAGCGCPCDMRMDPRCPQGPICDWGTYAHPDVDIRPMPENAGALSMSLGQLVFGPTVIRPALQGGLDFAAEHVEHNDNDRVALVLVAGGAPSSLECSENSISDAADVAANSNIKTYVVQFDYFGPSLAPIAMRGGGKLYEFESHRDDIAVRFEQLVEELEREPHCQYDLPQGPFERDRVNVEITWPIDGGTFTTALYRVKDRDACNDGQGWYYDSLDRPTRIVACDAACNKIHGSPNANVTIKVGCPTVPPPN